MLAFIIFSIDNSYSLFPNLIIGGCSLKNTSPNSLLNKLKFATDTFSKVFLIAAPITSKETFLRGISSSTSIKGSVAKLLAS